MHFVKKKSLYFFPSTVYRLKLCKMGLCAVAVLSPLCQQMTWITVLQGLVALAEQNMMMAREITMTVRKKCFPQKEHTVVREERSKVINT